MVGAHLTAVVTRAPMACRLIHCTNSQRWRRVRVRALLLFQWRCVAARENHRRLHGAEWLHSGEAVIANDGEEFLAELDTLDVGVVKERIASGVYLRPWKSLAQGWVEHKEAIASAEQMALARQAVKDAKWANWIALWALVIAAISLIVAVVKH